MDSFQRTHEVALERFKRNLTAKEDVDGQLKAHLDELADSLMR